jgi:hypothetical protein
MSERFATEACAVSRALTLTEPFLQFASIKLSVMLCKQSESSLSASVARDEFLITPEFISFKMGTI